MAELSPDEYDLLARIKDKEELRPFFFRKAKGLKWFNTLDQEGYFHPAKNPKPVPAKEEGYVNIPFWPATEYLVATSPELLEAGNEAYAKRILDVVRSVTKDAIDRGFGNYRTWWQFSKIIQNIPTHLVLVNDLALIDYWLDDKYESGLVAENLGEHWLDRLLSGKDEHCKTLAVGLLEILYKVRFVDKRYGDSNLKEAILRFDNWHAREITKKTAPRAGQVLGRQAVEVFRSGLERILKTLDNDRWSSLWRSAIEDHEQNHAADDAGDVLVEAMREALLAYIDEEPAAAKTYVSELLKRPFETIGRIAIYVINERYQQLEELTGHVLVERHFASNFRHELWHLLSNHYPQFSGPEKTLVQEAIGRLVRKDENEKESQGATSYTRAVWLKAIKDYGVDEAKRYEECIRVIGGEPEHPDFSSYMTSGYVDHKSPIPKDELLAMEVDILVERLRSYIDPGKFGEPGLEGLTKALRQVMKIEPVRYFTQLKKFASLDLAYVYEILEAYGDLWTEKVQLPWEEIWEHLLAFCEDVVQQDRFWAEESTQTRSQFVVNRYGVVGSMGRLIENGTRSDEHAFPEKYLDRAHAILLVLLEKEKGEEFAPDSDSVSIAINSPRGRCIEAFINLSLRACRLADRHEGGHIEAWKKLEPTYNSELSRADKGEYEFATLVVNYLPNFLYMSKEWVLENLGRIFDHENHLKWLCAMNGYAYVNTVYDVIYDHLKEHGHFIRALDDGNIREKVGEKIIQNIAVAFIEGFDRLDDKAGLLQQVLSRKRHSEMNQLIWFLWTLRKNGDQKIKSRVLELWPRILEVIDTKTREGRKLASKLCSWSVFVDEVNDVNKPLLLAVAPYAEESYNSHELLESIAKISTAQPREAYEIWRSYLEGAASDFPEEAIREALTNIARAGREGMRNAKEIVSAYLRSGNERPHLWLNEIMSGAHNA